MRCFLPLILVLIAPAGASGFHPVEDIASRAEQALAVSPGTRVEAAVDAGLRLPRCAEALEAVAQGGSTVEVGCRSAGWKLYVPVRTQRLQEVYVLRRPVSAGEVIDRDAVGVETRDIGRLAGGILPANQALDGRTARRALMAGSVLLSQDTQSPRVIQRGDPVVLVSRSGTIEVRASGRALAAAGVDDRLAVENTSSRRVVQGQVMANGEVLVR